MIQLKPKSDRVTPLLRTLQWLLSTQGESQNQWPCWHLDQIIFLLGLGRDCPVRYGMFSSILGFYPLDASRTYPPILTWPHIPCRTKSSPMENHCFIGIKGPMFSVPGLSGYSCLSFTHCSHIGLLCSSLTIPVLACAQTMHLVFTLSETFSSQISTWHLTVLYRYLFFCFLFLFFLSYTIFIYLFI